MQRRIRPDRCHLQAFDVEFQRKLPGLQSIQNQLRLVANESIDDDFYLRPFGLHSRDLAAMFAGRQIQLESLDVHGVHMHGRPKKGENSHTKPEIRNVDDGLNSRLVVVRISFSKDSEAIARNPKPLDQRNVERIELNSAFEAL